MRVWVISLLVGLGVLIVVLLILFMPRRETGYEYKPAGRRASTPLVTLPKGVEPSQGKVAEKAEEEGGTLEAEERATETTTTSEATEAEEETAKEAKEEAEGKQEKGEEEASPEEQPTAEEEEAKEQKKFIPAGKLAEEAGRTVIAQFQTNKGDFIVAIYPEIAPLSATHFIDLINAGFYDGVVIHRYEPSFVIQMGQVDPTSRFYEMSKETIPDEPNISENVPYTIAFAKSYQGGQMVPNSASTQFFINLGVNSHLDENFTVMGQVISGQEVVESLRRNDRIIRARIVRNPKVGTR